MGQLCQVLPAPEGEGAHFSIGVLARAMAQWRNGAMAQWRNGTSRRIVD